MLARQPSTASGMCPETRLQMPHPSISAFLGTNHSHWGRLGCNLTSMLCCDLSFARFSTHCSREPAAFQWHDHGLGRDPIQRLQSKPSLGLARDCIETCGKDLREDMYYIISISCIPQSSLGSHVFRLMSLANQSSFGITVLSSLDIPVIT